MFQIKSRLCTLGLSSSSIINLYHRGSLVAVPVSSKLHSVLSQHFLLDMYSFDPLIFLDNVILNTEITNLKLFQMCRAFLKQCIQQYFRLLFNMKSLQSPENWLQTFSKISLSHMFNTAGDSVSQGCL